MAASLTAVNKFIPKVGSSSVASQKRYRSLGVAVPSANKAEARNSFLVHTSHLREVARYACKKSPEHLNTPNNAKAAVYSIRKTSLSHAWTVRKPKLSGDPPFTTLTVGTHITNTAAASSAQTAVSPSSAPHIMTHADANATPKPSVHGGQAAGPAVKEALIIGGGLGGLLAAYALRKVGVDAQVYDRAETRGLTAGTLISLFPNGLKAIAAVDPSLALKLCERGAIIKSVISDKEGSEVHTTDLTGYEEKFGFPVVNILWSRIIDTITEYLSPECIHLGYNFTGQLREDEETGKVTALFEKDGKEVAVAAPLVIGSDGMASKTRAWMLGDANPGPRDNGRYAWRLVMEDSEVKISHPMLQKHQSAVHIGVGKVLMVSDPGEGHYYFAVTKVDERNEVPRKSSSSSECKARLLEIFHDSPSLLPIIEALDAERIIERRVVDLPPLPTWRKGRVLIIGDAAHAMAPTLGQGANQAFEDAMELSRQIAATSSLDDALTSFVTVRRSRVEKVVRANETQVRSTYSAKKDATEMSAEAPAAFFQFLYNDGRLTLPVQRLEAAA